MAVVELVPNTSLCVDVAQIAERLHCLANRITEGEFPILERIVVVLDTEHRVKSRVYGRPTTNMELVGLLEYAKFNVLSGEDDA